MACVKGSTQVVELLLKHGANINHINKQKVRDTVINKFYYYYIIMLAYTTCYDSYSRTCRNS